MAACLFPKCRLLFDGIMIDLFVMRKLDGDFGSHELGASLGQPYLAEASATDTIDQRINSDLLTSTKQEESSYEEQLVDR